MAERLLAHALEAEPEPLKSLQVKSAGVAAYGGDLPSANSVKALEKVGIDLSDHRSAALSKSLVDASFVIFCMTESHRFTILNALEGVENPPEVLLMRELMGDNVDLEIPDPFGGPIGAYEASRDSMVEAIPSILNFLRSQIS